MLKFGQNKTGFSKPACGKFIPNIDECKIKAGREPPVRKKF